jgi:hypothetical protein
MRFQKPWLLLRQLIPGVGGHGYSGDCSSRFCASGPDRAVAEITVARDADHTSGATIRSLGGAECERLTA